MWNDEKFKDAQIIPIEFNKTNEYFELEFNNYQQVISSEVPKYEGEYTVIPEVEKKEVPTRQKFLEQNIEVLAIPYLEVANSAGGETVTIG